MHTYEQRDGMNVLVVNEMQRLIHPRTKKELPPVPFNDILVHSTEIARYYSIPHQDIKLDNGRVQPGIWTLVNENTIGQRVPYNNEKTKPWTRSNRRFKIIYNEAGLPIDTEEYIEHIPIIAETDDGMYVRLSDVLIYADANDWRQGKGRPKKASDTDPNMIVAQTVAAVMASLAPLFERLGAVTVPASPEENIRQANGAPKKRIWTDEEKKAAGERMAAGRKAKADGKPTSSDQ